MDPMYIETPRISSGKASVPRFWRVWNTLSLPFLRGPLRIGVLVLYIDLRPGQTCHSKVMHRKEMTHSDGSYEKKSRRRALLTVWDKIKSHSTLIDWCTGKSDLWTAWQLFPLDDDQTCHSKEWVGDWTII